MQLPLFLRVLKHETAPGASILQYQGQRFFAVRYRGVIIYILAVVINNGLCFFLA
jgi:hypothetical protein